VSGVGLILCAARKSAQDTHASAVVLVCITIGPMKKAD
jgi:hypothetical protein